MIAVLYIPKNGPPSLLLEAPEVLCTSRPTSFNARRSIAFDNSSKPSPSDGCTDAYNTDELFFSAIAGRYISTTLLTSSCDTRIVPGYKESKR